jgi:hypothetical protein
MELHEAGENYIMRSFMTDGVTGSWRELHNEELHEGGSYRKLERTT